jgi:hypothetical protein
MCESPVSKFVTGLLTVCYYGYSFSRGCTSYSWHSVSFFRHELQKSKDLQKKIITVYIVIPLYQDFNETYWLGVACKTRNGNIVFQRNGGERDFEGNIVL